MWRRSNIRVWGLRAGAHFAAGSNLVCKHCLIALLHFWSCVELKQKTSTSCLSCIYLHVHCFSAWRWPRFDLPAVTSCNLSALTGRSRFQEEVSSFVFANACAQTTHTHSTQSPLSEIRWNLSASPVVSLSARWLTGQVIGWETTPPPADESCHPHMDAENLHTHIHTCALKCMHGLAVWQ